MPGLSQQEPLRSRQSGQTNYPSDSSSACRTVASILMDERSPQRRQAAIQRMVEADIIPRLLATYRLRDAGSGTPDPRTPTTAAPLHSHSEADAVSLAMLVIAAEPEEAVAAVIDRLVTEGEAPEAGCLELIADAARHLGVLWTEDKIGFEDVTIGMFHLQRMAHDLAPMARRVALPAGAPQRTLLLLTLEGDQHNLAKTLLANSFDSAGWQVSTVQVSRTDDVSSLVSAIDYDVVGFSMATDVQISRASACIRAVRRASHNRHVVIMVGGALILATPSLVETLGADGTAASAAGATMRAEELLNQPRRPKASPSSALR